MAVALQDHILSNLSLEGSFRSLETKSIYKKMKQNEKKRIKSLKNVSSTLDTGLNKNKVNKDNSIELEDKEYVLDAKPKPPSFAQRLGLVALSSDQKNTLTEEQWKDLKYQSAQRDSFVNPCPICKDIFRFEDQVLLSCSHVFHRACLQSFERFIGRKSCPMCRRDDYQTRVVHEGSKIYKIKSVIKIQSFWRGYAVRKWYRKLRETVPPKDAKLRKRFFENKLTQLTDRYVNLASSSSVDYFLSEIDQSVEESRRIFEHFEVSILNKLSEKDWLKIEETARKRETGECLICLQSLNDLNQCPVEIKKKSENDDKSDALILLSCSHLFHKNCLDALELFACKLPEFQLLDTKVSQKCIFKCPTCRSFYKKKILSLPF